MIELGLIVTVALVLAMAYSIEFLCWAAGKLWEFWNNYRDRRFLRRM